MYAEEASPGGFMELNYRDALRSLARTPQFGELLGFLYD